MTGYLDECDVYHNEIAYSDKAVKSQSYVLEESRIE